MVSAAAPNFGHVYREFIKKKGVVLNVAMSKILFLLFILNKHRKYQEAGIQSKLKIIPETYDFVILSKGNSVCRGFINKIKHACSGGRSLLVQSKPINIFFGLWSLNNLSANILGIALSMGKLCHEFAILYSMLLLILKPLLLL